MVSYVPYTPFATLQLRRRFLDPYCVCDIRIGLDCFFAMRPLLPNRGSLKGKDVGVVGRHLVDGKETRNCLDDCEARSEPKGSLPMAVS
jgi:hypothetical protein